MILDWPPKPLAKLLALDNPASRFLVSHMRFDFDSNELAMAGLTLGDIRKVMLDIGYVRDNGRPV